MDIRPEVLGQSARDTAVTHPTIQGNTTTAWELGESRKESPRLSVREYVNVLLMVVLPDSCANRFLRGECLGKDFNT